MSIIPAQTMWILRTSIPNVNMYMETFESATRTLQYAIVPPLDPPYIRSPIYKRARSKTIGTSSIFRNRYYYFRRHHA